MFPTIKRFFCAAGVSFLLAPSLHAATYPLAVSHATLGPSPVTFTLVEADGLNSGGSPGNTTRMVNASQFFSGSGFAAGSGLWQWRDFAGLNLRGGPNPGGVDLLEADPARNAPNLRTTVTGLPLAAYEVWLAYMTRNEGGELPQLLVDIETGAVKSPTTLRQRDQSTVFTGRTADRVWDVSLQPPWKGYRHQPQCACRDQRREHTWGLYWGGLPGGPDKYSCRHRHPTLRTICHGGE